jgi:hypothetical protein
MSGMPVAGTPRMKPDNCAANEAVGLMAEPTATDSGKGGTTDRPAITCLPLKTLLGIRCVAFGLNAPQSGLRHWIIDEGLEATVQITKVKVIVHHAP